MSRKPSDLSSSAERTYIDPSDDPDEIKWHLFQHLCACPCDRSNDYLMEQEERCPSDAGRSDVAADVVVRRARRAAKAMLLLVAFFAAVAQWSAIASGVKFFERLVHLDSDAASSATSATLAVCFLVSIVGGVLSDAWLGTPKVLFIGLVGAFSTSTILAALAYPTDTSKGPAVEFFLAVLLFLFAASCGLVQTAVPSLVGDQCHQNPHALSSFYNLFYGTLQLGAFLSRVFFPMTHHFTDWFVAIAVFMVLSSATALVLFVLNQSVLTFRTPTTSSAAVDATMILLRSTFLRETHDELEVRYGPEVVSDAITAARVLRLHLPLPVFWALYFQIFSLWFLQSKTLDLTLFSGVTIEAEQATALNPLLDVLLLISFSLLFKALTSFHGIVVSSSWKMFMGYFFAVASFAYAIFLQVRVQQNPPNSVSVWYQFPQYFCICAAEILVYPAALHQAYVNSPVSMRSFVQSCLWFFIGVGNTINAIVLISDSRIGGKDASDGKELTPLFIGYAAAMLLTTAVYCALMALFDDDDRRHVGASSAGSRMPTTQSLGRNSNNRDTATNFMTAQERAEAAAAENSLLVGSVPDARGVASDKDRRIRSPREGGPVYHSLRKSPRGSLLMSGNNKSSENRLGD